LITDHQVRETLEITDRSYVIRGGRVLCHGRPLEVLNNPEARKYYFGEEMQLNVPHAAADRAQQPRRLARAA
jgi:lipopolysaccharide export system ATP-binding protein